VSQLTKLFSVSNRYGSSGHEWENIMHNKITKKLQKGERGKKWNL
jgi:hypothetical protein